MKKILVAATPPVQEILRDALEDEFDIILCGNLEQAKQLLNKPVDLVICTVLFDDSRMFDFLRYAKTNPVTKSIPFICARARRGSLPHNEVKTFMKAAKVLGADEFVDIHAWINELGAERAFDELRATIRRYL
jgi:DNA-binding response OmpR family regulator